MLAWNFSYKLNLLFEVTTRDWRH